MHQLLFVKIYDRVNTFRQQHGFVSLFAIMILLFASTFLTVSLLVLSAESVSNSSTLMQSHQAQALANACAETALEKLKLNLAYTGNETIAVGLNNCQIVGVAGTGNTARTITTEANVGGKISRIRVVVATVNQLTNITSWQEVVSF